MKISFARRMWVLFAAYAIGFYASVINRFRTEGGEHIPRHGGTLLASNHISGYDTVFLPWAVLRHHPFQMVWAPAKEELFRNVLLGWLFRSWGAFPVRRRRDVKAGRILQDLLQAEKVMLFPEGTRNREGLLGKGNRGVGKLIYDARPTVVPTALWGLNRWKFPGMGQIARVRFGDPVDFSDLFERGDTKETHILITERLMNSISGLLEEIRRESQG